MYLLLYHTSMIINSMLRNKRKLFSPSITSSPSPILPNCCIFIWTICQRFCLFICLFCCYSCCCCNFFFQAHFFDYIQMSFLFLILSVSYFEVFLQIKSCCTLVFFLAFIILCRLKYFKFITQKNSD